MENFKKSIWAYLKDKDMDALKKLLNSAEELEILEAINDLSADEQVVIYRLLNKDKALAVFEQLDIRLQQELISSFTEEKAIEMVEELAPDDRVRLLDELPATVAKKLLESLSPEERQVTNVLLGYEAETAGRIMTTEYVRLSREMTVAEAMSKIKISAKDKETIYTLYITDEVRTLEGVISLRELLVAESDEKIEDLMQKKVIKVSIDTDQEEVARLLQELDLLAIPVVDKEKRLVGIITVDDAMDILEDEATEDMFDSAGIADIKNQESNRSEILVFGSLWQIWKMRLPFLIFTLIGGIFAGMVIDGFEETLESVAIVAVFIPIIMDMGGNVGTQSATVFTRGLLLGHIKMKDVKKNLFKEIFVGVTMGGLVGLVTGLIAYFWYGIPGLGIAVGLALAFTTSIAAGLGFFVPYLLVKFNIDQASGTGPIITSIKDITGLLVYFYLVTVFLGHLL